MLPLFCVCCCRVTSSVNFALKLHHPVQLVCTCGKGFKRNINPITSPPELKKRSSSASLDNSPGRRSTGRACRRAGTAGCDCWRWQGCCALSFGVRWHRLEFTTWEVWSFSLFAMWWFCQQYGTVESSICSTGYQSKVCWLRSGMVLLPACIPVGCP